MVLKIKHKLYEKNMIVFTAYMVYISYMIYISNTLAFSNQKKNPNINVYNILQGYSRIMVADVKHAHVSTPTTTANI